MKEVCKFFGIVIVVMGEGIFELFMSIGVLYVIEGGQIMNLSMEDIVEVVQFVNVEMVFIFLNNLNIVMAVN